MDTDQFKYKLGQIVSLDPTWGFAPPYKPVQGRVTGLVLHEGGSKGYFVSAVGGDGLLRHLVDETEIYANGN